MVGFFRMAQMTTTSRLATEVLKQFLGTYFPDFIGLTGDPQEVRSIAKQFSVAFFKENESHDRYQVSHSPQAFVLDRSGQLRAELYSASTEAMAGVANALLGEATE